MSDIGQKRRVWRVADLKLESFNRYGDDVAKLHWSPVTFDRETGKGAFIIRFDPGGESVPHEHLGYEEFYVIEGTVVWITMGSRTRQATSSRWARVQSTIPAHPTARLSSPF